MSTVFIRQSYFALRKNVRLNCSHCFIMKILSKQELQQITSNHSSNTDFKDFMIFYRKCTTKPYCFLMIDTTLASDNFLCFRNNYLDRT